MFIALLKGINGVIDSPTLKELEKKEVASELFSWLFKK